MRHLWTQRLVSRGPWPGGVFKFAAGSEASEQGIILSDNVNKELWKFERELLGTDVQRR